tara:strand:+ start:488 stop:952 length:465 start_codon:yes stop_codon:yes gene_type:complete
MNLREEIENQYKSSIKDKNTDLTNTLRLVKSAIKDKDIEARSKGNNEGISNQDIFVLLQSLVKQRKDSIEAFQSADRKDLIEKEQEEINIIISFLPKQKNEKDTEDIIDKLIKEFNFNSLKEMGQLMKILKEKYSGQIDIALAGNIAKTKLSNK